MQTTDINQQFIESFNILKDEMHATSRSKGWWEAREKLVEIAAQHSSELGKYAEQAVGGMNIALMHSELSEALENCRHGCGPDDHVPEFTGEEAEYADTIIRIMDTSAKKGLRVAEALIAKAERNKFRPHLHGGKAF